MMKGTTEGGAVERVSAPILAIGLMGSLLSCGLMLLGVLRGVDRAVSLWVRGWGLAGSLRPVPVWWMVIFCVMVSYGVSAALLHAPGRGRRLVLWVSCAVVVVGWLPVLVLADWDFPLSGPLVAVLWSGLSSVVFAHRHSLPCEGGINPVTPS